MMLPKENKMFVQLSSSIDSFRFNEMSLMEKVEEMSKPDGTVFFQVGSFREASELCRKFISCFGLTSSNWKGGLVVDAKFNFIAHVSYNGRVWNNTDENWRIAKEIAI